MPTWPRRLTSICVRVISCVGSGGVGGHEHVFLRRIDRLAIGEHGLDGFEVEIGEMDYGFEIGGILGMDFLRAANAMIDLGKLSIAFG